MTSSLDIKVDKLDNRVGGLDNRVGGLDIRVNKVSKDVDKVSKEVGEFSTKLQEFATNLTDFMGKTNTNSANITEVSTTLKEQSRKINTNSDNITKVSTELKDCCRKTQNNSDTILTVVELFKKHASQVRDIERVDELSEKYKNVLDIVTSNSRHIETLSSKIKKKGKESLIEAGDSVKPILESDTDFKDDEEPTARMMELVGSFGLNYNYTPYKFFIGNNDEIFVVINSKIYVYNKEGSLLREITSSNPKFTSAIYHASGDSPMYNMVINNNKIFFTDVAQYKTDIFDIQGNYIETAPQRVSNNGILYSLFRSTNVGNPPINYIGKYPSGSGDGQFRYEYSVRDVVVADNGDVFVSDRQNLLRIQVFDSEGNFLRKFPIEDTLYNKYKFNSNNGAHNTCMNIFENQLYIKSGHESEFFNNNINVYSLEGKFIYKFSCGTEQRPEISTFTEKTLIPILNFTITSSGEFCILYNKAGSKGIKIYKRGNSYIQRPLERKYKIYTNYQVEKDLEGLGNKKFLSIQFPLCIYQYYWLQPRLPVDSYNKNLLTHTIYFEKPQSVKKAIQACEEYFNEPVTKSDFQDLQSHCLLAYVEGRFASRELNWATCNHNRLCRGYFLGGNVLSGVKITEDYQLVLDITQD